MDGKKTPRPEVFISATSQDLGACRQLIKEGLLTIGCTPVEQTNFAPDSRRVREMLRGILRNCDAVVHVVGERYGAEPQERASDEPRRSYTQLEYDMARELGIPVYVFLCGDGFPYQDCGPESELLQELQRQHRRALLGGDEVYEEVGSSDQLQVRIHALQARVERLVAELSRTRSWLGRGLAVGLALVTGAGAGLWWLSERADQSESRLQAVEAELTLQRAYLRNAASAFLEVKSQLAELQLSDEELWARAVERTAEQAGLPAQELRASIELFVAVVGQDEASSPLDRAYARFAEGEFDAAAGLAELASAELERQRRASQELLASAREADAKIRSEQREAFRLTAQARAAAGQYREAVAAYRAALGSEITDPVDDAREWIDLQGALASAYLSWGQVSEGAEIVTRLNQAIAIWQQMLGVCTLAEMPVDWAEIHSDLSVAYHELAGTKSGEERNQGFLAAEDAAEQSLKVFTAEEFPFRRATAKLNQSAFMRSRMDALDGFDRFSLLQESIAIVKEVLDQVITFESSPDQWATAQGQLGNAYAELASYARGEARVKVLRDSIEAIEQSFQVESKEETPYRWAMKQINLAASLQDLAQELPAEEQPAKLAEAAAASMRGFEVLTRSDYPQHWASAKMNLASIRQSQALSVTGEERKKYLHQALDTTQAALEIFTREALPKLWASATGNLGAVLGEIALNTEEGEEQDRYFAESEAAYLASLEVYTLEDFPSDFARVQSNRGIARRHRATYSAGRERFDYLEESAEAFRQALLGYTREYSAFAWAMTLDNLCATLRSQAQSCEGEERERVLREAVEAMKQVVLVLNETDAPDDYYPRQQWIEETEAELAGGD